jgi:purine nucleoside phosphorylase
MSEIEELKIASEICEKALGKCEIAVIMGSGLNDFYLELENRKEISYSQIKYMPQVSIQGHIGKLISGYLNNRKVLVFAGRVHAYEGISFHEVCFQVRLAVMLGVKVFGLTNSTGGMLGINYSKKRWNETRVFMFDN